MIGNIVNNISTILNKYFLFFCYGKAEILAVITPVFSVTFLFIYNYSQETKQTW